MDWKQAVVVDYTGAGAGTISAAQFGDDVVKHLRDAERSREQRVLIVLDTAHGLNGVDLESPQVVRDHINVSGFNPLIGPNHPIGERFPVVNDVYVANCPQALGPLPLVVAAGVKTGSVVDSEAKELLQKLGADCYCFNLVPTMLVAAHAGWKILALVGPAGQDWQKASLAKLVG